MVLATLSPQTSIARQVIQVITVSVIAFIFVYLACCLALLVHLYKHPRLHRIRHTLVTLYALLFCITVLCTSEYMHLVMAMTLVFSGFPIYVWQQYHSVAHSSRCTNSSRS